MGPLSASSAINSTPSVYYPATLPAKNRDTPTSDSPAQADAETSLRVANFEAMRPSELRDWAASRTKTGVMAIDDLAHATLTEMLSAAGQSDDTPRNYIGSVKSKIAEAKARDDSKVEIATRRLWQILEINQGQVYGLSATV